MARDLALALDGRLHRVSSRLSRCAPRLAGIVAAGLTLAVFSACAQSRADPPCPRSPQTGAAGHPRDARLARVRTFAVAIGSGDLGGDLATRYRGYDLVVVDGQGATSAQIAALRSGGRLVLGYLDVGTIEPGRSWFARAKPYRLDYWADFGEWYANVAAAGYRTLIGASVAPTLLAKGFDGLFLDNVDEVASHPRQAAGMRTLVCGLAKALHRRHRLLFAQNGEDSFGPIFNALDGWNREDLSFTYDFAGRAYRPVATADARAARAAVRANVARGLLVTATDYTAAGDSPDALRAVSTACAAGALPFVSNIGLTRIAQPPARCP